MFDVDELLKDVTNEFWRERIAKSINSILSLYNLTPYDVEVTREEISADELLVAAEEECDLQDSIKFKQEYVNIPPPITVIQSRYRKVIFMGSNRSVQYVLHGKNPDCIIVKLPNHIHPRMAFEAKITLTDLIERQKDLSK